MEHLSCMNNRDKRVFDCWLCLLAVLVAVYSFWKPGFITMGPEKTFGMMILIMTDLLFLLLILTEDRCRAVPDGVNNSKSGYLKGFLYFLAATVLYFIYCTEINRQYRFSGIWDSIASSLLFCAAALSVRIPARNNTKK